MRDDNLEYVGSTTDGKIAFLQRSKHPNPCAKTVDRDHAYEVWRSYDGTWTWYVRKKWQADDNKPYARWFCDVVTPIVPEGESGDVYVSEIKRAASRVK